MSSPFALRIVSALSALAFAGSSLAQSSSRGADRPVSVRLEWIRGARARGCLDGAALRRAVDRRWRRDVFTDEATAALVVRGTIDAAADGAWTAVIDLRRANGESLGTRTLTTAAPDCSALDDSLALATGLMVDVSARKLAEENAASSLGASTSILIPRETLAPRAPWHWESSLGADGAVGLLPGVARGGRFAMSLEPPRFFRVELAAELWLPDESQEARGRGGDFSAFTLEADACPLSFRSRALTLHGCVAQRFGRVHARGLGFDEDTSITEPLWTVGARAVLLWPIGGPVAVRLGAGADAALVRYRFVYSDAGTTRALREMGAMVGSAEIGLSLRW